MKKTIFNSLALMTIGASSLSSFAQSAAVDADAGKFSATMRVHARYVLLDSTRKTNMDFMSQKLRLGGKYTQGRLGVVGDVDFRGNKYGDHATGSAGSTGSQSAGVRHAHISYDVFKDDNNKVTFKIGRFIPSATETVGNDMITSWYTTSGFFPSDGVMFQYKGKPAGTEFLAEFSIVNSMQLYLYKDTGYSSNSNVWTQATYGSDSHFRGGSVFNANGGGDFSSGGSSYPSNTSDKAYIASVHSNINAGEGTVRLEAAYGMKNNNVGNKVANTCTSTANTSTGAITCTPRSPTIIVANDVQYMELSGGYNLKDKLQVGAWYTMAMVGEDKYLNDLNAGAAQFTSSNGVKNTYSIIGIGVQGDSRLFGLTDVMGKDGLIIFGAGSEMFMRRQSGGAAGAALSDSDAAKNDSTILSIGGGYSKGKFSAELNYTHFMSSSNDIYLNQGNNNLTNSADLIYLATGISI